jgi:hypothetical protein
MREQPSSSHFTAPIAGGLPRPSYLLTVREGDLGEWHAFLARTPGGSYQQTGWWAVAKMKEGFRARRLVIRNGDDILGGAQMLYRSLPVRGAVAYVPLGPYWHRRISKSPVSRWHICIVSPASKTFIIWRSKFPVAVGPSHVNS